MAEYECKNCKNEKTCPSKKGSHKYCFEPRVKNEYIEREVLIDEINRCVNWNTNNEYNIYSDVFNLIDDAPAADVAPVKHGEWTTVDGVSMCSECGYIPLYDKAIDDFFYSNYCPNCGAIMDGKDGKNDS